MARDYHAILAILAPFERVFSIASNLISKKRSRIYFENIRYILCLRFWGILALDDDEHEVILVGEGQEERVVRHGEGFSTGYNRYPYKMTWMVPYPQNFAWMVPVETSSGVPRFIRIRRPSLSGSQM